MQLSQQEIREDVLQLAQLLVESHPDPYAAGGGPLAFHRRVADILEAVPENGLTAQQLLRRVRPLVASLQDGHTSIREPETSSAPQPRPWVVWEPVEEQLVLTGVYRLADRPLLGARLTLLEGVPFAELVQRVSQLRGCDNIYQQLITLAMAFSDPGLLTEILKYDSLPCSLQLTLLLPDGTEHELELPLSEKAPGEVMTPTSSVSTLPTLNAAQLGWSFLDPQRRVACLRATSMMHYREAFEFSQTIGNQMHLDFHLDATTRLVMQEPLPESVEARISVLPSATALLLDLFTAMREANSTHLIVDVRHCPGGNSIFASMLVYFLYGVTGLLDADEGYQIKRYSPLYFENYQNALPESLQREMQNGGYDFSDEQAWQRLQQTGITPEERQRSYEQLQQYFSWMPTFAALFEQRQGEKIWTPDVLVLTSADTYSAGFDVAVALLSYGARIIGVSSAQAGNCFIDALFYRLKHSRLEGSISFKRSLSFPNDLERGKLLRPTHELTYEYLASQRFDPHATISLALEHLVG